MSVAAQDTEALVDPDPAATLCAQVVLVLGRLRRVRAHAQCRIRPTRGIRAVPVPQAEAEGVTAEMTLEIAGLGLLHLETRYFLSCCVVTRM